MNKFYFILLLCLFSSCRINKTNHVETCKTENDSTEQFYDQSEGMEILDTLGKVYGNEPHIAGLSLETPNCPDFIEGIYFDKATLVFQVTGDTVKARQILEKASGSIPVGSSSSFFGSPKEASTPSPERANVLL